MHSVKSSYEGGGGNTSLEIHIEMVLTFILSDTLS